MKPQPARRLTPTARPQKSLGTAFFLVSIGTTLACTVTLLVLALRGVPTEDFGYAPRLLILLVVVIFVIASLAITEILPWRSRNWRDWSRPKVLGSFVALGMGALSLGVGLTPIFNPPAATEKTLVDLRDWLVGAGLTRGEASLVERQINGSWGEPGCQVTYDIQATYDKGHDKGLLTVVSHKSVVGQSPLRMEFETERGRGGHLVASVLNPQSERGQQHEFAYEQAGPRAFLTWVNKTRAISLTLDRCVQG